MTDTRTPEEVNRAATDILNEAGHALRALVVDTTRNSGERNTAWQARTTVVDRLLMMRINALAANLDALRLIVDPMMERAMREGL